MRWRRDGMVWGTLAALSCASTAVAAFAAMVVLPGGSSGPALVETAVPFGRWAIRWGRDVEAPAMEQARQLSAASEVAAVVAMGTCLLAVLSAILLWRQRVEHRRDEYRLRRAVGARRDQLLARLAGEGWIWAPGILTGSVLAALLVPYAVARTFPGSADPGWGLVIALLPPLIIAAAIARLEVGGGELSRDRRETGYADVFSSLTLTLMLGFVVLTAVRLLVRHAPAPPPPSAHVSTLVQPVMLGSHAPPARAALLQTWQRRARESGVPLGLASAGTARGTGVRDQLLVDCGRCSIGGMPVPVQSVRAELHSVAPDTFAQLDRTLEEGRDFSWSVDRGRPGAAIVNRSFARERFQDGEAVGRRVRFGDSDWLTVVGVVSDREQAGPLTGYELFLPLAHAVPEHLEALATLPTGPRGEIAVPAPADADVRLGTAIPMAELFGVQRWFGRVLGAMGFLTLILVTLGASTAARSEAEAMIHEIGLRRAFGARDRELRSFLARALGKQLAFAFAGGAWLSLFLGAGLHRLPVAVPQFELVVWAEVALVLLLAVTVASASTYRRAIGMTPGEALRRGG